MAGAVCAIAADKGAWLDSKRRESSKVSEAIDYSSGEVAVKLICQFPSLESKGVTIRARRVVFLRSYW